MTSPDAYHPNELSSIEVSIALSWIRKIARHSGFFPKSFVLHGVKKGEEDPVACGGFSDIYKGMFEYKPVALKVIRSFGATENGRQMNKVRIK